VGEAGTLSMIRIIADQMLVKCCEWTINVESVGFAGRAWASFVL